MAKKKVQTVKEKLFDLFWDTNDNLVQGGKRINRKHIVNFDGLPTPTPDFDSLNDFSEATMAAEEVIYAVRDAIIVKFVNAAVARGLNRKTARAFIEKQWRIV